MPGYNRLYIRRGENGYYSTAFARNDGTVYIGGVKTEGETHVDASLEQRKIVCRYKCHDLGSLANIKL